jgi:hypothetical protein
LSFRGHMLLIIGFIVIWFGFGWAVGYASRD